MFSFFRRQKTADSDKIGKGETDKNEAKGKEKHSVSPSSPNSAKRVEVQDVGRAGALRAAVSVQPGRKDGDEGPTRTTTTSVAGATSVKEVQDVGRAGALRAAFPVQPGRKDGDEGPTKTTSTTKTTTTSVAGATSVKEVQEVPPPPSPTKLGNHSTLTTSAAKSVKPECNSPAPPPTPPTVGPTPTSTPTPTPTVTVTPGAGDVPVTSLSGVATTKSSSYDDEDNGATKPSHEAATISPSPATTNRHQADNERAKDSGEIEKRNLVNQETRFQEQLAALTAQLTARDTETNKLTYKMEELQRDVQVKSWGMDRLQAELSAAHKESECVRQKLRKMENDVTTYRQKNQELVEELAKKADEVTMADSDHSERMEELRASINDLEAKMKELERQLEEVRAERDQLEEDKAEMEAEREEEMKIVQEALEETQEEKDEIQARFEKDFERLRTVNTDREQQLLNDFEWKLREVEQACKRRLEEKDKKAEEKIATWQREMADKIQDADQQLKEAQKLKSFEAETVQLRGVTHDQQRSLRAAQRQTEQLQVSERMLKEEVSRLRTAIDSEKSISQSLQSINDKKISDMEKKFYSRVEQQKSDMDRQWEDKLRRECLRLKTELDKLHLEEKQIALNSLRAEKEQEIRAAKQSWEQRIQESLKQVAALTDSLTEKEAFYHKEIEKVQTNADRDVLELRRKLDKMDMSYQEQIEKLNERHEQEMEQLNWEATRKIQQLEQNWQLQASSTRTTLELVKEQMERDTQDKLEALEAKHREKIELQWERLTREKETEVDQLQETHHKELQKITEECQQKFKSRSSREAELMQKISALEDKLRGQCAVIGDLQGNTDLLQGSVQVLNEQIVTQGKEVERTQTQAAQRIREREAELEAEWGLQLAALKEEHSGQVLQCQAQHSAEQQELLQQIDTLTKLLEESRAHQESRVSQPEDIQRIAELTKVLEERENDNTLSNPEDSKRIADLMNALAEREQELSSLTEEKRFYQLELINRETTYNQIFRTQPVVGVIDPLQYANGPRKKGGGRGNPNPNTHHVPSPPRLVPKSPRKHKKGGGGNMTPAQVLRSKSLDFKQPPKSKTKHKNTHTATVTESPEESLAVSTL